MAWREFCPEQETLKKMIAGNVHDKSGARVSPDRIIYVNVEKNCADSSKQSELAEVWFYVSKSGSKELHKCLTLKAYQLFKMFFDNGNTKQLGPDFEEKVVHVELAGNSASKYGKKSSGKIPSLTVILIAVAGGVGLFLMLLVCCCLSVCGRRRSRRSRKYDSDHPQRLHVIHNHAANRATEGSEGSNSKNVKKDKNENIKKDDSGEEMEVDDGKGGYNAGYEYANENDEDDKNNTDKDNKGNSNKNSVNSGDCSNTKNNANGRDKLTNQGDESATKEPKSSNGDQGGIYGNLKTDGIGEHTYASINKQGDGKCDSGKNGNNVANVPVVVPRFPPIVSGSRPGGGGRGKEGSSPGDISSGIGTGGERQKRGSQSTPVLLRKSDADPKNQDRRGSYVQSLADDDVPLTHKTGTVGIVALAIRNRNEMKKETEFKNLNKDVPSEEVKYPPDTASKNRSPDVLPAPATRVKLPTQPDYINANWIRDHKGQRCYIATQHPLQETMEDFWRMVWGQQANTVVMVNDEEKDKVAFTDYLPKEEGNSRRFGNIEVAVKQTTEKADLILTVLTIAENENTASSREVSHFRFTSWKERAMPNVALFVAFVTATREEREKHGDTKAPIIVHCSDGLGFTGVYIAVDIGIKSHEESKKSVVDVFELSKNLRRDRHGIVCSLEHYNFIYQVLYEYTVNYDNDK